MISLNETGCSFMDAGWGGERYKHQVSNIKYQATSIKHEASRNQHHFSYFIKRLKIQNEQC